MLVGWCSDRWYGPLLASDLFDLWNIAYTTRRSGFYGETHIPVSIRLTESALDVRSDCGGKEHQARTGYGF